ncbi:MAG: adenylate/guanylate cyclase domain-containing protein [Alphaproteobacteria bacterium]|nr:adenylate/guanylate cyclase domain-containing protein [Alphaproteobacteria bacterium]
MGGQGTSYEVSIFVRNHWEIQSRFPGTQKDQAIDNARSTERARPGVPVKVIQEAYDARTGRSVEITVYKTPDSVIQAAKKARAARQRRGGGGGGDYLDLLPDPFDEPAKPKGSMSLMAMVLMILMASSGISAVATLLFSLAAPKFGAMLGIGSSISKEGLFGIFMIIFLLTSGVMIATYRSRLVLAPETETGKGKKAYKKALAAKEDKAEAEKTKNKKEEETEEKDKPTTTEEDDEGFSLEPDDDEEDEDALIDKAIEAHDELDFDEPDEEAEVLDEIELAGDPEVHKVTMMNFITGALKSIANKGSLDNFARFGINLFTAGAVEMIGARGALSRADIQEILQESVQILGTKEVQAAKFSKSFESYLLNSRYVEMVAQGREAMSTFMDGDLTGAAQLATALDQWMNPPEVDQANSGPLAVMFTDIVGSTDMTVTLGDHAAQHMVRTHNRIVRTALTNFYGREIKHTGDGIMASFADVPNAVKAAIEIQKRTLGNNLASPDQAFNLTIGIEAGEPIAEENDLFGVTVQMAARLCAACETDQILISQEVCKTIVGTEIQTQPMPPRKMKGFAEPVPLWAVLYDNQTPTPAGQAPGQANAAPKLPGLNVTEAPAAQPNPNGEGENLS